MGASVDSGTDFSDQIFPIMAQDTEKLCVDFEEMTFPYITV